MKVKSSIMKHRLDIASDLRILCNILWKSFPNGNFASIESAINELRDDKSIPQLENYPSYPELWGYESEDLLFRFESLPGKSKPFPIQKLDLFFCIKIRGNSNNIDTLNDPLHELKFDIVLKGDYNGGKVITSYHLDRHILNEDEEEKDEKEPVEPHPLYHFQFGGNRMIDELEEGMNTGNIMFLDAPRILHYPMDMVLGIDFIISNFFSTKWKDLIESNPEYNNLVSKYQERLIKPYLEMLNNRFKPETLNESSRFWDSTIIKPQFI